MEKDPLKTLVMEFMASHFIEIGYGLFALAVGMLVGAVKIAVDLYLEYKATRQALNE